MKKLLIVLGAILFSIYCAAQGRITEFQRILEASEPASAWEVELQLNSAKNLLNATMLERVFSNGCSRTHFSLFEKNQELFSPSIEFLNIGYPDLQFYSGNVELFDCRAFGKGGIAGYSDNLGFPDYPTHFGNFIANDEIAARNYIDIHLPTIILMRKPSCRFSNELDCWYNPFSFIDPVTREYLSVGNIVFRSVASVVFHKMRRLAWSFESHYYRSLHCRGF